MRIGSPILSLSAQRTLGQTTKALARSMERLASGRRINSARDDASGLAISSGIDAQVRAYHQGIRNINDAMGFLNTADGALETQASIIQRMRELAMQAANGIYSDSERSNLDNELQELFEEFQRITRDTSFNRVNLLDGTFGDKNIQVGGQKNQTIRISLESMDTSNSFTYTTPDTSTTETVGTGTFTISQTLSMPTGYFLNGTGQIADLNGDSNNDLIWTTDHDSISVRLGNGNGTFSAAATITLATGSVSFDPVVKDLNGDSKLDLFILNNATHNVTVMLGNGNGTFSMGQTLNLPGTSNPNVIPTALDLNGDSRWDFVWTDKDLNSVSIRLGNGDGTFSAGTTLNLPAGAGPEGAVVGTDLNGDSKVDLVFTDRNIDAVSIRLGNGDGTFSAAATLSLPASSSPTYAPTVVDLNSDSKLDMVWINYVGETVSVRLGNGDGTFSAGQTQGTLTGSLARGDVAVADINNDSKMDMVWTNEGDRISVRLGNGDGTFSAAATISVTAGAKPEGTPTLTDLNGDDDLDLIWTNQDDASISVRLGNGNGTFAASQTIDFPGFWDLSHHIMGDFNGDGVDDIAALNGDHANAGTAAAGVFLMGSSTSTVTVDGIDLTPDDVVIETQEQAEDLLALLDYALSTINSARADIGAQQNRLAHAASVSTVSVENLSQARSQIIDADLAEETAEFSKNQILTQAGVSVLSQANLNMKIVLELLNSNLR